MNQKYIAPEKGKGSFTCPYCHALSLMKYSTHHHYDDVVIAHTRLGVEFLNELYIAKCVNYGKKKILLNNEYISRNLGRRT